MKVKKIISTIISALMCFSMLTFNVSAAEFETGLTSVSGQTQAEAVNILQLANNAETTSIDFDYDCDEAQFDINSRDELSELSIDISDILGVTPANEELTISPRATANPVSSLKITAVGVGNTRYDLLGSGDWKIIYADQSGTSNLSREIDATDCLYVCFRIFQWGYTSSHYIKLDGASYVHTNTVCTYNALGQVAGVGDVAYGFLDEYIFEIPKDEVSSTARFIGYYKSNGIAIEANANITWTTPTGPAPTTPEIYYNIPNEYDGAVIMGLTADMEYCAEFDNGDNGTYRSSWYSISSEALLVPINAEPYTVHIRYKKSTNGNPSLNCSIPIKSREAAPTNEYVGYDDILEVLAIYPCEQQIEVALGDGTSYIPVSAAYYTVGSFIDTITTGGFNRIYVRYAATVDRPASMSGTILLYGRNPNTPDDVYYQNGMLHNLTPNIAFRFNGGNWYSTNLSEVNITSFMSTTGTTLLEVKYIPSETTSCSKTRQIILPALSE